MIQVKRGCGSGSVHTKEYEVRRFPILVDHVGKSSFSRFWDQNRYNYAIIQLRIYREFHALAMDPCSNSAFSVSARFGL
jgi:hypothetical protein